jgi:hypothetical protein
LEDSLVAFNGSENLTFVEKSNPGFEELLECFSL